MNTSRDRLAFRYRRAFSASAAAAVALTGVCGLAGAAADVTEVCDEGQRGVVDVKNAMQPLVDAIGQSAKANDGGEAGQPAVGKFAWLAKNSLGIAVSRLDSVNSLDQLGLITEKASVLVDEMRKLSAALEKNDYTYVDPVIDEYNAAAVAFMAACKSGLRDSSGGDEA